MNAGDFMGFHFLPPSIHLPPALRPVHGATVTAMLEPASVARVTASTGAVPQHTAVADHVFPLNTVQL